jgi:lipopolysaccharide biosynthesis glycosyltransferase
MIHVVFSSDERYAPHMGVAMTSILLNSRKSDELSFHVLSDSISPESIRRLLSLRDIRDFQLQILDVDQAVKKAISRINTISTDTRITEACYYRLLVGSVFPELEKVLYLDCDLVVLGSLNDIWETDLSDHTLAAVEEIMDPPLHRDAFLKISRYFNSGVLLFNLLRWRDLEYERKCLAVPDDLLGKIGHHDQSILNYLFREGDVRYLDARFNYMISFKEQFAPSLDPMLKGIQPLIVHYAGAKPWHLDAWLDRRTDLHSFEHYWKYWELGPWSDMSPIESFRKSDVCRYLYRHPKDIPTAKKRMQELKRRRAISWIDDNSGLCQ